MAGLEAARRRALVARTPALISEELVTSVVKGALVSLTESGLGPLPLYRQAIRGAARTPPLALNPSMSRSCCHIAALRSASHQPPSVVNNQPPGKA